MDLIMLILAIAIVGFLVYIITTYIPMPPIFVTAIQVITLIVVILYLIQRFAGGVPNLL